MVCRASWGERESSGGNDDENERTRLVEVRPTGPVSSCNGGWTALIDNRQEHQPLSRAVASRPLLYIEVSHLERRLLLQPLLERELQELRVRRALGKRDRRTCSGQHPPRPSSSAAAPERPAPVPLRMAPAVPMSMPMRRPRPKPPAVAGAGGAGGGGGGGGRGGGGGGGVGTAMKPVIYPDKTQNP